MEWPPIERGSLCTRWATTHLRYESQQQLNAKFILNISVTAESSLLSPTGGVNRILLDTAIHEQNGYEKDKWIRKSVYNDKHTFDNGETIVDNNIMTRRTWTRTTCRIEHTCTLSVVALSDYSSHHMAQAARTCLSESSHPWTCAAFLECFLSITFYLLPFLYFFPCLMTDGNSVTINNLRDSANGTFVTLDDYLPLTKYEDRSQEETEWQEQGAREAAWKLAKSV